jgi:uncharacterized protein (TIGR03382 family)
LTGLLLLAAALAADPAEPPKRPKPCPPPAEPWLDDVAQRGDETSYKCLIETDEFLVPLVEAIGKEADEGARNRYTRALALHLAARADKPWEPAHVRLLNAADRRLLADAVKARKGRQSPSPEHDAVFQKQWWYRVDTYTDNELTEVEKANIAMANDPPPPADPDAPDTDAPVMLPPVEQPPSACGCASSGTGASAWGALALGVVLSRRRLARRARAV